MVNATAMMGIMATVVSKNVTVTVRDQPMWTVMMRANATVRKTSEENSAIIVVMTILTFPIVHYVNVMKLDLWLPTVISEAGVIAKKGMGVKNVPTARLAM